MAKLANLAEIGRILDAWLPGKILYDRTPGLAVGIVHKGKLVYSKGFGLADISSKTPVTTQTNFRIASISKTFTSIAILQLADAGKLKLSDPIKKHLSWVKGDVANLTIRQVLSHTGGVLRDGDTSHWSNDDFSSADTLRESFLKTNPIRSYRKRFKYSTFGFALLGEIIRTKTEMSYEEYVNQNIVRKLGMENTYPDYVQNASKKLASGYSRDIPGEDRTVFTHVSTKAYAPAAGFISNVDDLAKYVAALCKGTSLISAKSKKEMLRTISDTGRSEGKYGLGFEIAKIGRNTIFGHGGGFPGFRTKIQIDAKNELAIIVLTNTTNTIPSASTEISKGIFELIYELPSLKPRVKKLQEAMKNYEGWYRSRWAGLCIVNGDTCLYAFNPKAAPLPKDVTILKTKAPNSFEIESSDGFGNSGELAIFEENKMHWGTMPYTKLSTQETNATAQQPSEVAA